MMEGIRLEAGVFEKAFVSSPDLVDAEARRVSADIEIWGILVHHEGQI